jgi:alkylhydroperoxidase family enzyme
MSRLPRIEAAGASPEVVALFERVRAHYGPEQTVELAYIIATENMTSRFNRSFRVESQGFFCMLPASGAKP